MPDGSGRPRHRITFAPRLLTQVEALAYLGGISAEELRRRMRHGQIPTPMWGVAIDHPEARWDRASIDRALDAASNAPATIERATSLLDQTFGTARR